MSGSGRVQQFQRTGFGNVSFNTVARRRAALRLGTCLTGAAAALLIGAAPARAQSCGTLTLVAITCPAGTSYPSGIAYSVDATQPPQDLTVRLDDGVQIETTADQTHSISVSNLSGGGAAILADGASAIATSGQGAKGILAETSVGDLTVHVGDVATAGGQSTGIQARSDSGAIAVHAGTIATVGDDAPGIDTRTNGTTTIDVTAISTQGANSAAIHAYGSGPITVQAGTIETQGYRAHGIYANNNLGGQSGGITIDAGNVNTAGYGAAGIWATGYAGDTHITAQTVAVQGSNTDAVYGSSYLGNTSIQIGSVSAASPGGVGIRAISGGATDVTVGDVTSDGIGILAIGTQATVIADTVSTSGDNGKGVYVHSDFAIDNGKAPTRDLTVNIGSVVTSGYESDGVYVRNGAPGGRIDVTVGSINTFGDQADGIVGIGYGDVAIKAGSVVTSGAGAFGVGAISKEGAVTIDVDHVKTAGQGSQGIYAKAAGAVTVSAGSVETAGAGSHGINVQTANGTIDITAGSVRADGANSVGVYAVNYSEWTTKVAIGTGTTTRDYSRVVTAIGFGDIAVQAGTIKSSGYGSTGLFGYSVYGNVSISGQHISTAGGAAYGVDARALDAKSHIEVSVSSIETSGKRAAGVVVLAGGTAAVDAGTVKTSGDLSDGIYAAFNTSNGERDGPPPPTVIKAGTIAVTGDGAHGINVSGRGDVEISVDSVTTEGGRLSEGKHTFWAEGISAGGAYGFLHITAGSVTTKGEGSVGIDANVGDGDLVIAAKEIATSGGHAVGVLAGTIYGNTQISVGTITTAGEHATGVQVSATGLPETGTYTARIEVGAISTAGVYSKGVEAKVDGDLAIVAGTIATQGETDAGGIVAVSYGGNASVSVTGGISTKGAYSTGVYAVALQGNVQIDAAHVAAVGAKSNGVAGVSLIGDVAIRASDVAATGGGASAVLVVSYQGLGHVSVEATNVTGGDYANAIQAYGASVEISTHGTIHKTGSYAAITAQAVGGGVTIHNDAAITTAEGSGPYGSAVAHGISAQATGDVTIDGSGTISTAVGTSNAISAYSIRGGTISITQASLSTSGDSAHGISAVTSNGVGTAESDGPGGITVSLKEVSTQGEASSALLLSDNTRHGDVLATVTGKVSTHGNYGEGVSLYAANGTAKAVLNSVETKGVYAQAVHLNGERDVLSFSGALSTEGVRSNAVVAYAGNGGIQISGAGPISTTGSYFSSGVRATSPGDITIALTGPITTTGRGSAGIEVTERKRHSEVYPYDPPAEQAKKGGTKASGFPTEDPRIPEEAITGSTIAINAAAITTTGAHSNGVMASTTTGSVAITTGKVVVSGQGSIGVFAEGRRVSADVGATQSAQAEAVALRGFDAASLSVRGAVSGGTDGAVLQAYTAHLTVASGGSIAGVNNGVVIDATPHVTPIVHYWGYAPRDGYVGQDEPQPLPPAHPAAGAVRVDNAGTITGGSGFAIVASGGPVNVTNTGMVVGAVKFAGFNDSFVNNGTFVATKDSDFGGGSNMFVNSGTFVVGSAAPAAQSVRAASAAASPAAQTVTMVGLNTFENHGLIDFRGAAAGDTLVLPGNYVGAAGAKVRFDVTAQGSGQLVIAGAATGTTTILLGGDASAATLMAQPRALVKTSAGASANAFSLGSADIGLVHYALAFDAASGSVQVRNEAGAPIYRLVKLGEGAQAVWRQSAEAWSSHMLELRDVEAGGSRLWGQSFGSVADREQSRTIGGNAYRLDYRQDFYGAQVGVDFGGLSSDSGETRSVFGLTAGYLSARQNFKQGGDRVTFDTLSLGGYGMARKGAFYGNLLAQYDHHWVDAGNRGLGWSDRSKADGYGIAGEIGAHLGTERLFAEPQVSLSWQHTDIGSLRPFGQRVDFGGNTALTGKLGGRIGGVVDIGATRAVFYARGDYVREFDGKGMLSFGSGGVVQTLEGQRMGDYGQAAIGVNILSQGLISGFVEGNATFGTSASGGGGRAGIRIRF